MESKSSESNYYVVFLKKSDASENASEGISIHQQCDNSTKDQLLLLETNNCQTQNEENSYQNSDDSRCEEDAKSNAKKSRIKLKGRLYKCSQCSECFPNYKNLKLHSVTHSTYPCLKCTKVFKTFRKLNIHSQTHYGENDYECEECGELLNKSLNSHFRQSDEWLFKCTICDKDFTDKQILKDHLNMHSDETPFKSPEVNKSFQQNHQCTHRVRVRQKPYMCSKCDKCFILRNSLNAHMKSHTSEKQYKCNDCGKSFAKIFSLKRHFAKHTGEKLYQCPKCNKLFKHNGSLVAHYFRHTLQPPYLCSKCGKSFNERASMNNHYKIYHSEESPARNPFECLECGRIFSQKFNLQRHYMKHTGEKPHVCSQCGKAFIQKGSLESHFRTHTGEKPFRCEICDKYFADRSTLCKHKKIHYGKEKIHASKRPATIIHLVKANT